MAQQNYTKFVPYLAEIRRRLLFIFSIFIIASGLGFFYYEKIIGWILKIFELEGVNIVFTSPFQFFSLALTIAICAGLVIVLPLILYQVFSFLKPALSPKEFKTLLSLLPLNILLFIAGFGFGVAVMRYVVVLFYQKSVELNIGNILDISLLLSQILITSVLMGIAFQYPVILTILMRLKILDYKSLQRKRWLVYGISLIFSALLPPTDILSLAFLFIPLALLFELTLILNRWLFRV
ncbi:hypothetical protein A3C59_04220 [Candidatus Daviesbacteria bacterium RIFCSPHIGHO2_02_FULL_36_13]|uniref:Sec-independent protein translocase protein TatC n=1 Tax=Candidatus Daviesbacteria bacterium RIFCSPHIGHO2_02_FULL_36_13 TaxID=1797768 RepID=A0A1F5JUA4_9BACT|nr:MAG: hypothetical protein A3C59_04220 [Candidatus Daviesbacteria bacterium RIFCSPHIGHO2_02_FULL_36_13]OGE44331.1 MAG: hypothetical protein A3A45_03885 [Candidatus Daviesbacteria bacterium RIFCSPLOWO2_01_FULL_36_8]